MKMKNVGIFRVIYELSVAKSVEINAGDSSLVSLKMISNQILNPLVKVCRLDTTLICDDEPQQFVKYNNAC